MITFKNIDEKEMQNIIDTKEVSDDIKKSAENVINEVVEKCPVKAIEYIAK